MKRMILILCFCIMFLILHTPLIYSEIKKPDIGTEKKYNCKECHSRSATIRGSEKPTVQGQSIKKHDDKLTPPQDHIRKDKRKNKGQ